MRIRKIRKLVREAEVLLEEKKQIELVKKIDSINEYIKKEIKEKHRKISKKHCKKIIHLLQNLNKKLKIALKKDLEVKNPGESEK